MKVQNKSEPPDILASSIHVPSSKITYFPNILLNAIPLYLFRPYKWLFSKMFPHKNFVFIACLPTFAKNYVFPQSSSCYSPISFSSIRVTVFRDVSPQKFRMHYLFPPFMLHAHSFVTSYTVFHCPYNTSDLQKLRSLSSSFTVSYWVLFSFVHRS